MSSPLPIALDELCPEEVERLRPVLLRIAWERHVRRRFEDLTTGPNRKKAGAAIDFITEEEVARGYPITRGVVERIVWPSRRRCGG